MSFSLTGKTALVTGSSRGIGRAAAFALGRAGAKILFHGSRPSEALEGAAAAARAEGIGCEALVADLCESGAVSGLAAAASAADILVLNASVQSYGHIADFSDKEFERIFRANVRASFQLVQAIAPKMCERKWGRIVCIGSVNQAHPAPRLAIYAASKAAFRALVLTAAKEYMPHGVTVNTVTPGVIATDRNAVALSDADFANPLRESIPAGRFGTPEDCAGAILYLASNEAAYVTGANIVIDGGFSL